MLAESWCSYGTSVNRRSAETPPAFTVAPPGNYGRRPGLNRGVAIALTGVWCRYSPGQCGWSNGIAGLCRVAAHHSGSPRSGLYPGLYRQ
ncbi:hypothetical protein DPMN_187477 [Dreissena polymorpha]|uniref:Uncharacterized protein n=1 Tax=Dreissena polymorpha TaxID=45954 RepID=A0A9D4DQ96_DREPO|nr:hypothetical protein DPMN_187477 [Dreissena polymorpha]